METEEAREEEVGVVVARKVQVVLVAVLVVVAVAREVPQESDGSHTAGHCLPGSAAHCCHAPCTL